MDIIQVAAEKFKEATGNASLDLDKAKGAIAGLFDGDGFDIGSIVSKLKEQGLSGMVSSWLGDGDNDSMSSDQVKSLFGGEKLAGFAEKLGLDEGSALSGLKEVIPNMIDKASAGGELLEDVIGNFKDQVLGGLKKLF